MLDRRRLLQALAATAGLGLYPLPGRSAQAGAPRLVVILLRGGLDGLHALPPIADPDYARLRAEHLAVQQLGAPLALDGDFGLHPLLATLHDRYRAGQALFVHAVATPYRERSHFDAQDLLESGHPTPHAAGNGWLQRALGADAAQALAVGASLPLLLRGEHAPRQWSPSRLPAPDAAFLDRVAQLYAADADLLRALNLAREQHLDAPDMSGAARADFAALAGAAGKFLREDPALRVAALELGGWDSHSGQFGAQGPLSRSLRALDSGIRALHEQLGPAWDRTVVCAITEFGRTVAVNGSGGTDHGTASVTLLCGGALAGGRVLADWPGLKPAQRHEGRDLKPTTDLRALLKGLLAEHLALPRSRLDAAFPGAEAVQPLAGLIA